MNKYCIILISLYTLLKVHRRLLMDDYFGVDEALNEPGISGKGLIVRGKIKTFLNFACYHFADLCLYKYILGCYNKTVINCLCLIIDWL